MIFTQPALFGSAKSMAYQLTGTVKKIFEAQTFPSGFSKREFVVATEDKYPQEIKFDCLKEKAEILDGTKEGEEVTVHFDLGGREYNGRYFVNLNAWRLDKGKSAAPSASGDSPPDPEDTSDYSEEDDDVPF